jgi:nucleotidyltransferase/DNA polymerase involved in DNA repair
MEGWSAKYPRAILHVDGDAFFASCEVAKNPTLRGKPVVVGGLRGIAVALTYEAKARGVTRGMPVFQIKKLCPEAVILAGDYDLYEQFATRMYAIVRRYTPDVEEYSVDECFAELYAEPEAAVRTIQADLMAELGVSFSVGLATTKVLAKVASKYKKPKGLVCIPRGTESEYLKDVSVGKVWGIGPATAQRLNRIGVRTALEFRTLPEWRVREGFAKPHVDLWRELNGESVFAVHSEGHDVQKSIAATRTFRPPTKDKALVFAYLVKNIEEACRRARARGLEAQHLFFFLKSQEFQYRRFEAALVRHTNATSAVVAAARPLFEQAFAPDVLYRATGVTLSSVRPKVGQAALFGDTEAEQADLVFETVDRVGQQFGAHTLFLAPSLAVRKGPPVKPHFALPYLGEVQ